MELLNRCVRFALVIKKFKIVVWVGIFLSFGGFIWLVLSTHATDAYYMICIVALIWFLCLLAFSYFPTSIPEISQSQSIFGRLVVKVKRTMYGLLAASVVISTVAAIYMSAKLISMLTSMAMG